MEELKVSSPAFESGGWIPDCHSAYGENKSPKLLLEGLCEDAVSMAITLDDADHPLFPNYNHWLAWNLPPVSVIPENLPAGEEISEPFSMVQGKAYGKHCYKGPKPPLNWNHLYRFTVYVLDTALSLPSDSEKKAVINAMEGHILQTGILEGKYQRKHK